MIYLDDVHDYCTNVIDKWNDVIQYYNDNKIKCNNYDNLYLLEILINSIMDLIYTANDNERVEFDCMIFFEWAKINNKIYIDYDEILSNLWEKYLNSFSSLNLFIQIADS